MIQFIFQQFPSVKNIYKNIVVFCLQPVTIEGFNCKMLKLLRCVNEYRII